MEISQTPHLASRVERTRLTDGFLFACFAVALGTLDALLLLGWHDIKPTNLDWLQGDPAVYQAGWEFLRHSHWTFPPTWISRLDYPFGVSAGYLDVIPLLAVPLRLVSGVLPADFQYLGVYAALCLILQTWFGAKLVSRFSSDRLFILIGSLFFLNAPILLSRLYGHFSLCSQWLIVAALYYYFAPVERERVVHYILPFAVLLGLASGITPYIAVMVLGIGAAALVRWHLMHRTGESPIHGLLCFAGLLVVMISGFMFFGFLTFGAATQLNGAGYGMFSMNLLGPFNPGGAGLYFKQLGEVPGQDFEGYNYLGMGVFLLAIVCVARRPELLAGIWGRSTIAISACALIFALLALSTKVTLGSRTLVLVPFPQFVMHGLAVFRSSGRFFWPTHYLIVLGAIAATVAAFTSRTARCAVLGAAFVIQFLDIAPVRVGVDLHAMGRFADPLVAPDWSIAARTHRHLVLLPAWQCDLVHTPGGDADWAYFAWLAARNGITLNSTHAARDSAPSTAYNCISLPREVRRGELATDTAYVLSDALALSAIKRNRTHYCRRVDGFNLCTYDPARSHGSTGNSNDREY